MKTSSISPNQQFSYAALQEPVKPFVQKKAQTTRPQLKNFFEMVTDLEKERKQKRSTKKALELQTTPVPATAFLEKALMQNELICVQSALNYQPVGSAALVEAVLEKVSYQIEKGVEKTSIFFGTSCNNPSLKGSEITITCYDTAPMSFHLDFFSSAQGVLFLSSEMGHLKEQLQKKFPEHFFCFANPCLNSYIKQKNTQYFSQKVNKTSKNSFFY